MSGFQVQNASHVTGLRVQIRVIWDKEEELDVEHAQELMIGALPEAYMELEKRMNAARKAAEGGPGEVPGDAGPGPGARHREAEGEGPEVGSPGDWPEEGRAAGWLPVAAREEQERRREFREYVEAKFPPEAGPE